MPVTFPPPGDTGPAGTPGTPGGPGPTGRNGRAEKHYGAAVTASSQAVVDFFNAIEFSAAVFDDAEMFSPAAPTFLTVGYDGPYFICARVNWPGGTGDLAAQLVATYPGGEPRILDADVRPAANGTVQLFTADALNQGERVSLEVKQSSGSTNVTARLSLLGGLGQRLYWLAKTYFDAELASALIGKYVIVKGEASEPTKDARPGVNTDLSPGVNADCSSFTDPGYPYDDDGEGGERDAVKLVKDDDPAVRSVTWAALTNDECDPVAIEYQACALSARGIAKPEEDAKWGVAFQTAVDNRVYIEVDADEIKVITDIEGVLDTVTTLTGIPTGPKLPYDFSVDFAGGTYSIVIDGIDVVADVLPVRATFDSATLGRAGMFTRNGDTLLVPGPRSRLGAIVVQTIAGEAHLEPPRTGVNASLQAIWRPVIVPEAGDYRLSLDGSAGPDQDGRVLNLTQRRIRGGTAGGYNGYQTFGGVAENTTATVIVEDGNFEFSFPEDAYEAGDRIHLRIDAETDADLCDPIKLIQLGYRL